MVSDGLRVHVPTSAPRCLSAEREMESCLGLASQTSIPNPKDVLLSLPRALEKGRWVVQAVRVKTSLWMHS